MLLNLIKKLLTGTSARSRYSVSPETEQKIQMDWENIQVLLKQKSPSQLRHALITADKSLDNALRDVIEGETMGERLKNAKARFDPVIYNKIWEAHKVRNSMVHESGYEPPHFIVTEAIENLRRGLNTLGVRV